MLSFVYQPSFSGSLNPCPSLSLSTAASVYGHRGWLLPTLATRGAENAPKATLADTTCTRSGTITTNMEHMRNAISAVSSALITRNGGEERTEVRGRKKQQRGEEKKQYISSEVLGPTGVLGPIVFSRSAGCVIRDVSALRSGTCNPWASLNRRHRHSRMCEPRSPYKRHLVLYPIPWEPV